MIGGSNIKPNEFNIEFTDGALKEINRINDYISNILYNKIAADKLVEMINKQIEVIKYSPYLYTEIN